MALSDTELLGVCMCRSKCVVCPYALCPPGGDSDGLNMEVRSNFKAKVRCATHNDEREWPPPPPFRQDPELDP